MILYILTSPLALLLLLALPTLKARLTLLLASSRHPTSCPPPTIPSLDPLFNTDLILSTLRLRASHKISASWVPQFASLNTKTFASFLFGRRTITTCDPRNVHFFIAVEAEKFGNAPMRAPMVDMIGRGVITSDGPKWKESRTWVMPTFTRRHIADVGFFERHFARFLSRLERLEKVEGGRQVVDVNLKSLFDELVLDATSEFIFGTSFDSQMDGGRDLEGRRLLRAFTDAQITSGMRVVFGRAATRLIGGEKLKHFEENVKVFREYTLRQIKVARLRQQEKGLGIEEDEDKQRKAYILVDELAKEIPDDEALCDELLNVFFAGRDAPAVALSNIFFSLARNPEVWTRMRKEIEGVDIRDLSFEKLKSLRYIQYAINEGQRLYPALPIIGRVCLAETALPYGGGINGDMPITVVPGDIAQFNIYVLHRSPEVFGPDVEACRPERWEHIRPGWSFLPFSGGARHCPANQLALFWLSYTIVRLVMEFEMIENTDPVMEYEAMHKLNMENKNGNPVRLTRG